MKKFIVGLVVGLLSGVGAALLVAYELLRGFNGRF